MKKNYYELQVFVRPKGYVTICTYYGIRSNANRKFRLFLNTCIFECQSIFFRVQTYSSLGSMLAGDSPIKSLSFNP